jgi:DMSO reductase anchor subunit
LSREVIVLPAFMGMTFVYAMINISGWNPVLFSLNEAFPVDTALLVGAANAVLAFSLFVCTAMIYACVRFLQEWASPLTVVNYILLGTASGFTLTTAFAAYVGSNLVQFYGGWAIVLTVAAFITRGASLIRNSRIKYKSNLSSAIGIRHTNIKQKAQGSMGGSFNTREYSHGKNTAFLRNIKWLFLLLVFIVPVALLSSALGSVMGSNMVTLFALAFVVQYIGLIAERWFFFAQANHPQNLYYQTI